MKIHTRKTLAAFVASLLMISAGAAASSAAQADLKPLDTALKNLTAFQSGIDSAVYWKFREAVLALRSDPAARSAAEGKLLAFLGTPAPLPAKMAVCRELRIIGGPASIPALEKFLTDLNMSDPARYALEEISDPAADAVLLRALGKTTGPLRLGIISSLGFRKAPSAIEALGKIVTGKNEAEAVAAAYSLGRIGGKDAASSLSQAFRSPQPALKSAALSAALTCAEGLIAEPGVAAERIANAVLSENPAASIRQAAYMIKISAAKDRAYDVLLETLKSPDEIAQGAAIAKIKDIVPSGKIGAVSGLLSGLPEANRVKFITVLAGYPGDLVRPAILNSLKSSLLSERIAALKALAFVGDASAIPPLAEKAAQSTGEEQAAARASLGLIKGREADDAVLSLLGSGASEAVKSELIQAVGERRIFSGKSALVAVLSGTSVPLNIQALKVLKVIGTPSDIPALLDHLAGAADEAEREETENASAALALKIADPIGRADWIKGRLRSEKDNTFQAGLVRVLGKIGDDSSLPDLRGKLASADSGVKDAAARAIIDWPTAAPIEDVFDLAKSAESETHRLLALRGFIRMIAFQKFRKPENAVSDLKLALEMSRRPEEKRLALAALPVFACPDALKLARTFLNDPGVQAEAKAAVAAIEEKLKS